MEQIQLETAAFEGKSNAYLLGLEEDAPTTLIDTGIAAEPVEQELRTSLQERGVTFETIDHVMLTHFHYDHSGLAGAIQAASGATVFAHPADAALVGPGRAARELTSGYREKFEQWGIPETARTELVAFLEANAALAGESLDVSPFRPGDVRHIGDRTIEAIHLPGHTRGHLGYAIGDGELISGDALLPEYTPNIGGADVRVEHPLETYLRTLQTIVDRADTVVWPGHRGRIDDPISRAEAICAHHRDRLERVVAVLEERESADVWTVSAALFGSLSGIHILHGPGEAFAHLDHLACHGIVEERGGEYRLGNATVDAATLVPALTERKSR